MCAMKPWHSSPCAKCPSVTVSPPPKPRFSVDGAQSNALHLVSQQLFAGQTSQFPGHTKFCFPVHCCEVNSSTSTKSNLAISALWLPALVVALSHALHSPGLGVTGRPGSIEDPEHPHKGVLASPKLSSHPCQSLHGHHTQLLNHTVALSPNGSRPRCCRERRGNTGVLGYVTKPLCTSISLSVTVFRGK